MIDHTASDQPVDIPGCIKIDGAVYALHRKVLATEDGEFCPTSQAINVQAGIKADIERVLVLHELVHACYEHAGSPPGPLTEEHVACLVSRRLLPILRDNPNLVAYLTAPDA